MEIKPVNDMKRPGYPQKNEIDIDEVKKSMPKRWAQSPAAKIALGTLAAVSLSGCVPQATAGVPMPPSATTEQTFSSQETAGATAIPEISMKVTFPPLKTDYRTEGIVAAPTINVAPLFIHGEGRGTYGCDMVTSPAYISEYEALTVINEVAEEYGLKFSDEDKAEFSTVLRPVTHYREPDANATAPPDVFITLEADFTDSKHGVAIEYITIEDVKAWCKDPTGLIDQYDTKDAAAQLSEALESAGPNGIYNAGVMYDPCEISEDKAAAKELAQQQLKAQATDFFEWLKTRGVI